MPVHSSLKLKMAARMSHRGKVLQTRVLGRWRLHSQCACAGRWPSESAEHVCTTVPGERAHCCELPSLAEKDTKATITRVKSE